MATGSNSFGWLLYIILVSVLSVGSFIGLAYVNSPISAVNITGIHDSRDFDWSNVVNTDLQRGRRILPELKGPESIAIDDDGNWYTGLSDGSVVKIINPGKKGQAVINVTESFDFAEGGKTNKKRPLGLRLHGTKLYIADAYHGIIMIDVVTGEWDQTVAPDDVTPSLVFPDDLVLTSDGKTLYFTDMSLKWPYHEVALLSLEGECSGRVFKVDISTKLIDLVKGDMCQPNGIGLDPNDTKILVIEHSRRRIAVIDAKTQQVVRHVLLPGGGDNIRRRKDGGYWVPLPYFPEPNHFTTWDPAVRNVMASILGEQGILNKFSLTQGAAIKLDEDLQPVSIHYDLEGKLSKGLTEVQELDDGHLVLGSFIIDGIVIVDPLP